MRLLFTIVLVCLAAACCTARPADDDYVYEDDAPAEVAPAPSTKAPARHGLVSSRTGRGPSPLIGSRGVKTTTAAPVKAAEPEVVNEPEDVDEEVAVENEEVVPVTTEAPKKGLMRGVVRPFRSNQDLLAALKRKRQQEHNSGGVSTHPPASATTATPAEPKPNSKAASRSNSNNNSNSGRRTYSRPGAKTAAAAAPAAPESSEETETPKKPAFPSSSRRFSARGKTAPAPAPVSEDPEGDEVEEPAPRSAKSFRGGRRV